MQAGRESSFFLEDVLWIEDHEYATAAGEQATLGIADFCDAGKAPPVLANLTRLHSQRLVQRYWPEIFDGHARGGGWQVARFVELAHGIIENGGDNSAVAVARRAGVALAQAEITNIFLSARIGRKFQVHAAGIVQAAGETVIPLLRGFVTTFPSLHAEIVLG